MKRCVVVLGILILAIVSVGAAEPVKGIGVGLDLGLPLHVGAIGEYNFGPAYAGLDLGYDMMYEAFWLRVEGGYNVAKPFVNANLGVDLYLSVGGAFDLFIGKEDYYSSGTSFGIGFPITWSYTLEKIPLKFYAKAGPELYFGGGSVVPELAGSIGGMYVFEI